MVAIDWLELLKGDQSAFIATLELKDGISCLVPNGMIARFEGNGMHTLTVQVNDGARAIWKAGVTMEMTWDNLTKLFTWASQHGSGAPLADTAGETIVIDGTITREDFERFMAAHSPPEG